MADLSARFLPQFVKLARSRLVQARSAVAEREPVAISTAAGGMHQLAGEAGLLGLHDVVPLARECELEAKALHASGGDAEAERLSVTLGQLEQTIEQIGATLPASVGDS
jgi:HPt (histidine-containing phosphotransfer) domain-containing protein